MQFPKLTPLQSRFAATFAATLFLIVLYLVFSNPSFAYAAEFSPTITDLQGLLLLTDGGTTRDPETSALTAHHEIGGGDDQKSKRALPLGIQSLGNNQFQKSNIDFGQVQYWVLPNEVIQGPKAPTTPGLPTSVPAGSEPSGEVISQYELRKREAAYHEKRSTTVYISMNTCLQPSVNETSASKNSAALPPPLEVYISTSVQSPGPGKDPASQSLYTADGGFMSASIAADDDVYIAVAAPNSTDFSGIYNYEIATSIDDFFHSVDDEDPFLYFVDSDLNSALLETNNVTQAAPNSTNYNEWMNLTPPWTIFVSNQNYTVTAGLERSYCALSLQAQIRSGNQAIQVGMTSRGLGNKPKEDIYIVGLNRSSTYTGILGMTGNSTASGNGVVGGGGKVWRPMQFFTKAGTFVRTFNLLESIPPTNRLSVDENCALLYNLTFCDEVAYAVPSNPALNFSQLSIIYDSNAQALYQNFSNSLEVIQCNTSPEQMYSLAVGCSDCAFAYKQWLCAVTIPRCADFSNSAAFLQPRNAGQAFLNGTSLPADGPLVQSFATNASRNPIIDSQIKPGPYKEVLPCQDLCNELVRTCPASFGFSCPTGKYLNISYGFRDPNGDITCSYLGAAYYLNAGSHIFDRTSLSVLSILSILGFWFILLT